MLIGDGPSRGEARAHRKRPVAVQTLDDTDPNAVAAACRRLGLPEPVQGTAQLFSGEASDPHVGGRLT